MIGCGRNAITLAKMRNGPRKRSFTRAVPALVAGARFELATFGLWARRATGLLHPAMAKALIRDKHSRIPARRSESSVALSLRGHVARRHVLGPGAKAQGCADVYASQ